MMLIPLLMYRFLSLSWEGIGFIACVFLGDLAFFKA
jgi:hypothetical protein